MAKKKAAKKRAPQPRLIAHRTSEGIKKLTIEEALAESPQGISILPVPNMTPPGWEPIAGIASNSMDMMNHLTELAHRLQYSGEIAHIQKTIAARAASNDEDMGGNEKIHLTAEDIAILRYLDEQSPRLCAGSDIESGAVVSRKTVGDRIGKMLRKGLVCRPEGERGGAGITPKGCQILRSCPAP